MADWVPLSVVDYEALARDLIDPGAWDYFMGGAGDEISLTDAHDAWDRLRLRPRVLVDVSRRDLSTTVFGRTLDHPVLVAPMAAHDLAHREGERATARGAADAGALLTLSTISSVPLEEVASVAPAAPRWFQLYAPPERGACQALVERAVAAGYGAIVVTVDLPLPGNRERDVRNAFRLHTGAHLPEDQPTDERGIIVLPTLTWDDLAWLRSITPIPLLAKGILRADDAARAVETGCDGVWVSNHGGRQLDTAIAGVDALPEIVEAIGDRAVVVVDGGVRRGIDVLKGLALGATLVAVGRPVLWGLAVDGAAGVERVLRIVRDELSLAMALAGCRSIGDISRDLVAFTDRGR
ncbi:MAG TPA: alpha-hydroxy acid oxidase [Candidatus Limnocylindria bacterium]|nr:alpha-hydroxy acid oxidase [Candidatus Limnocylindria bacterium]